MALETATETTTQTAPAPEPAAPTTPDWRESLPEELRAEPSFKDVPDVPTLAKRFIDTKKMVGGSLKVPKEGATPEEVKAFHTALGVPAAPDKYTARPPAFPEDSGITLDEEGFKGFLGAAHSAGITDKQAQAILDWYGGYTVSEGDRITQFIADARKGAETSLKQEWGAQYGRNVALARQTVRDLFSDDPDLAKAIEEQGNNLALMKGLVKIGERMMEHGEITAEVPPGQSLEAMQAEVTKLRSEMETKPGDDALSERYLAAIRRVLKAGGAVPTA